MFRSAALDNAAGPDLGTLPTWDLRDLYPGMDSPELKADLVRMEGEAKAFHEAYAGRVASLDGDTLARAVREYERIDEVLSRAMSYAGLVYSGNMADPEIGKFYQSAQERVNGISTHLVFFTLEINRIDEDALQSRVRASKDLAHYASWIRDVRLYREHQLSDELERLLHEKHVVGRAAWNRLFDETIAGLRFPMGGPNGVIKDLTCAEALNKLSDRDPAVRREAGQVVGRVLGDNIRLFALVTNTLAKDKEIEDKWRNYPTPVSARNLSNRVEDEVVEALVAAVKQAYPSLSHRYYTLKARWFGQTHLDYWDRNAPLPDDSDRTIPWAEARDLVLGAYGRFSPELASYGKRFFDNPWIDAPVRPGKAPGAFAHPTVPSAHPYLLVNYQGKTRDVMTLAHELGHGVHQILAGRQGHLMSDTPLTLAETASVFGEMLTFRALLDSETDPKRRKIMLASKVEDMLNTVVRQIAFFDFETRVHTERRDGELTPERLGEIWMGVQTDSLGPALRFDEGYRNYWAYIPHFVHSPFYVYAYAFGDCLVNSLYAVYQESDAGFAKRYLAMLEAGGTLRHKDLLAPFGLDATDPAFWQKGLGVIRGFLDELETAG
ncbi:M3 family oligoendopeptidase [Azospirillum sp. TSO22-1]|uniref:M3 family oligoendopeptidase n=1 Tax=Azospirillum sp. TSO22-1 TaxID=716789 RepID=UPI000D61C2BE|nr:M3 family oligoendopeptidase [Azospirillum sp. TSO22-1]PWC45735.1 oligoendopeptidase F [Azospirillum sp. TSO22-1]